MPTPGTPAWIEAPTGDPDQTRDFYTGLFGWTYTDAYEGYSVAMSDGEPVAGFYPPSAEPTPPGWLFYLHTADLARTSERLAELGAKTVMGPLEIPGTGHVQLVHDPAGAVVGFWQATSDTVLATGRPGALAWQEVNTRDAAATDAFYGALFPYEERQLGDGEALDYKVWSLGGEEVAGRLRMGPEFPPDLQPHWMLYFGVTPEVGTDKAAERVTALGGTVGVEPFDSPYGRIAVVRDPYGSTFSLVDMSRTTPDA
ncbi:VOC family protein [Saccharothrix sp. NPDC042600]|uniref:VOC family protein n=1 Tax=Saccharothrix TaxID=2071 RepID=UPI0033FAEEEE|nr:VOC family protein [Saccharothrix mutabilis subsp. capreolus]